MDWNASWVSEMEFNDVINKVKPFGNFNNMYWGTALSGEVGEVCALVKEEFLEGIDIKEELKYELADVFNYVVLMARHNGIDLEKAILEKIEIAKEKWKKTQERLRKEK